MHAFLLLLSCLHVYQFKIQGKFELQTQNVLRAQAEGFNNSLKEELAALSTKYETEYSQTLNEITAQFKQSQVQELMKLQSKIADVESQLFAFHEAVTATSKYNSLSKSIHGEAAALLAFEKILETSAPVTEELKTLKSLCKDNELVNVVLSTIPKNCTDKGIATISDLRTRFKVLIDKRNDIRILFDND